VKKEETTTGEDRGEAIEKRDRRRRRRRRRVGKKESRED
jgi:hypothetical protein